MQRRSVVGRLAAAVAGLSLAKVPELSALTPHPRFTPADIAAWAPNSHSNRECPVCDETWDDLVITPAGVCLRCAAKADPTLTATPHSNPFWLLSPEEIKRADGELQRLHAESKRLEGTVTWDWNDDNYDDDKCEVVSQQIDRIWREALVLHMLREASRQFAPSSTSRLI